MTALLEYLDLSSTLVQCADRHLVNTISWTLSWLTVLSEYLVRCMIWSASVHSIRVDKPISVYCTYLNRCSDNGGPIVTSCPPSTSQKVHTAPDDSYVTTGPLQTNLLFLIIITQSLAGGQIHDLRRLQVDSLFPFQWFQNSCSYLLVDWFSPSSNFSNIPYITPLNML